MIRDMLWNDIVRDWVVSDLCLFLAFISIAVLTVAGFIRRSSRPVLTLIASVASLFLVSICILFAIWLHHYVHYDMLFAWWMFLKFAMLGWGGMVALLVFSTVQAARKRPIHAVQPTAGREAASGG